MKKLVLFSFVLNACLCLGQEKSHEVNINFKLSGISNGKDKVSKEPEQPAPTQEAQTSGKVPQVKNGLMCSSANVDAQSFMKVKYNVSYVGWDMYKAKDAKKFMETNCLLSTQVADLVKLIESADWQLDVAQFGYIHTYDQANYQVVVDALKTVESKKKLLDFLGSYGTPTSSPEPTPVKTPVEEDVVVVDNSPCSPMGENDFDEALESAADPIGEDARLKIAKSIFGNSCLSTGQVIRIVEELFIDEDKRLQFAKYAFTRTSDRDKYHRVNRVFIDEQKKTELSSFVAGQ